MPETQPLKHAQFSSSPQAADDYDPQLPYRATDMQDWQRRFMARGCFVEQAAVVAAFVLMVVSNVLSTASTLYNNTSNKIISDGNPTFITPDGTTFSVWGFIYAGEAALVVYQALPRFRTHALLVPARRWLVAAFVTNALWLPVFQYYRWWLALLVIVVYLYSLYRSYHALRVDYGGPACWHLKAAVFTGVSFNFAWVLVATLLNLTVVARNSGIITTPVSSPLITTNTSGYTAPGEAVIGGNVDWAVMCIALATSVSVYRAVITADVPYAFVTAWALGGIYRMQTVKEDTRFPAEALSATTSAWALAGIVVVGLAGVLALLLAVVRSRRNARAGDADKNGTISTTC